MPKMMPLRLAALGLLAASAVARADGMGLASLGVGYEDNVVLAPDQIASSAETGDNFFEVLGVGSWPLAGGKATELAFKGSAYALDYWDLNQFDLATLRAGPELRGKTGSWRWWLEGSAARVFLDYDAFEELATLEVGVRRHQSRRFSWSATYKRDWISAHDPYSYLSGSETEVELAARYGPSSWRLEGGYELELNDRDDLREGGNFASYSPTRHSLFAEARVAPGNWRFVLEGELRHSTYNDPHRQNGQLKKRRDTRYKVRARLARQLTDEISAFAETSRTVNDSNFEQAPFTNYNYTSNMYLVGLERFF